MTSRSICALRLHSKMGLSDLFISVDTTLNCTATPSAVEQCFPDDGYGIFQLLFLMAVYGEERYSSGAHAHSARFVESTCHAPPASRQASFCSRHLV